MILTRCHVMQIGRFLEFPACEGQMHVLYSAGVSVRLCDCPMPDYADHVWVSALDVMKICLVGFLKNGIAHRMS